MLSSERLKGITAFVCAADAGSFTEAAIRLNLTKSAVGKSVARMEERLGTRLFERTTRRLSLTSGGEAYYRTCSRILGELEEAEQLIASEGTIPLGRIRIDLPATYGKLKAMPLLLDFAKKFDGLRPVVSFTDRYIDPVEDGVDIVVRIGGSPSWSEALGHQYLGRESRIFCCSQAYAQRVGVPANLDELMTHRAVLYGRADGTQSAWLIRHDAQHIEQRHVEGYMVVGNAEAQVDAVLQGMGIAQFPTWLIDTKLTSGELLEVVPALNTDGLPLYLLWQKSRQSLPKVELLLTAFAEKLRIA